MRDRPLLSIVTVNRNNREGLRDTYNSLHSQSEWNKYAEWILIDAASSDDSLSVLNTAQLASVTHISEPDAGIYDGMNKGLRLCRGDWVLFLNSGDILADDSVVSRLANTLSSGDKSEVFMGDWHLRFPDGHIMPRTARSQAYLWHSLPTSHQAMVFPTSPLDGFEYDLSYEITGDYYIAAWLLRRGLSFRRVGYAVAVFAVGGKSYTSTGLLLREAARVQREVLRNGHLRVGLSALLRVIATGRLKVLTNLPRRG